MPFTNEIAEIKIWETSCHPVLIFNGIWQWKLESDSSPMTASTAGRTKFISHVVPMQKCRRHIVLVFTLMTSKMTVISRDNKTLMSVKEFWQFKWNRCARFTGHLSNRRGAFDNWIKRSRRSTYYARMVLTSSIELQGPGLLLKDLKGTVTLYRRFQNFASCDSVYLVIFKL